MRRDSIRMFISLATQCGWYTYQLNVKSAFPHDELIYFKRPNGFKKATNIWCISLKKVVYAPKQAPRVWYDQIEGYFAKKGFGKCIYDHTLFKVEEGGKPLTVSLYVDGLIFTRNNRSMLSSNIP